MASAPGFLYRNRYGIFCFQRRVPTRLKRLNPSLPTLFRMSLRTKDRAEALRYARKLTVMLEELQKRYFDSAEEFSLAMKLLQQTKAAEKSFQSWEAFEEFLNRLEDEHGKNSLSLVDKAKAYLDAIELSQGRGQSSGVPIAPKDHNNALAEIRELVSTVAKSTSDAITSIPLAQAMDEFIESRRINWKAHSDMETVYRKEVFPLFSFLVSTPLTGGLSKNDSIAFKNAVLRLPKSRRKMPEYRNIPLGELLAMEIPEEKRLSTTTMKGYMDRLKAFLDWLGTSGYAKEDLSLPLKDVVRKTGRSDEEKPKFSDEDLRRLFNSPAYTKGTHPESFKYWVPLLLLFTGARTNEICQLFIADIKKDEESGLDVIDINEQDAKVTLKSLKRKGHARLVPIHPTLIKLGFLRYVEFLRAKGQTRLFPELPYRSPKNKYGDKALRWFNNTYINRSNCNTTTQGASLHSLRHNFINCMGHTVKALDHEYAFYVGQSAGSSVTNSRYLKAAELKKAHALFKRVTYSSIDLELITPFDQQSFYRKLKSGRK